MKRARVAQVCAWAAGALVAIVVAALVDSTLALFLIWMLAAMLCGWMLAVFAAELAGMLQDADERFVRRVAQWTFGSVVLLLGLLPMLLIAWAVASEASR